MHAVHECVSVWGGGGGEGKEGGTSRQPRRVVRNPGSSTAFVNNHKAIESPTRSGNGLRLREPEDLKKAG